MGELFDSLFGIKTEHHSDGSRTERHETGGSFTYNSDGALREYSRPEHSGIVDGLLGIDKDVQVTYDGDGKVINIQKLK